MNGINDSTELFVRKIKKEAVGTPALTKDTQFKLPLGLIATAVCVVALGAHMWSQTHGQVMRNTNDIATAKDERRILNDKVIQYGVYFESIMRSLNDIKEDLKGMRK